MHGYRPEGERDYRTQYERLVNSLDGIIWEGTTDTRTLEVRFTFVSDQIRRILGYEPGAWLDDASRWVEAIHEGDRSWVPAACMEASREGRPHTLEYRMVDAAGRVLWVRDLVSMIEMDGDIATSSGLIVDITDSKQTEAALRESEQRYRVVVEHTGQAVYDYDLASGGIHWSDALTLITGFSAVEPAVRRIEWWENHIHPQDRTRALALLEQAMAAADDYEVDYRFLHADGSYRHIHDRGSFLVDASGQPYRMLGTLMDITERKKFEDSLREREAFLDSVLENLPVTVFVKDAKDLCYVSLNKAGEELLEVGREEVIGKSDYELQPKEFADQYRAMDREAIESGMTVDVEEEPMQTVSGETRTLHARKVPIYGDDGSPTYLVGIAVDITERMRYEEALIEAKEKAEEMNRLKSVFLANMSHEIRTPLTSIIGFAEVLAEDFAGEGRDLVEMIRTGGERLMETLNSVLDLAQLESGSLQVNRRVEDVGELVAESVAFFERQAAEKDLQLVYAPPAYPVLADTDRGALGRILSNLISNAIKFTEEGCVTVSLAASEEEICLSVADTGVGIDADFLPRLFEEFQQESSGVTRRYEGSGLGLTITKRLVELLDGQVEVTSQKGAGSTFTVRLRRASDCGSRRPGSLQRATQAAA